MSIRPLPNLFIPLSKHKIFFVIRNFKSPREYDTYTSKPFPSVEHSETKWCLELKLIPSIDLSFYSLKLKLLSSDAPSVTAEYACSIIPSSNVETNKKFEVSNFNPNEAKGFENFVWKDLLYNDSTLLPNGNLTLLCEVSVHLGSSNNAAIDTNPGDSLKIIIDSFISMLKDGKSRNVILCSGGREFLAHKSVLAHRSPVFEEMFAHAMEEIQLNRYYIEDIESEILREMLHHIYMDKANLQHELARKLLPVAEKYILSGLKAKCEIVMSHQLTVKTVVETLLFADKYNAQYLKGKALEYISVFSKEVVQTDYWKVISACPQLLEDCFKKLSSQMATMTVDNK